MRRLFIWVSAGLILGQLVCRAELANGIQAVVHDSVVTMEDVADLSRPTAEGLYREFRAQPEQFQKKMAEVRTNNLEQLVTRQLILHEFKTAYNVPESILDKDVDKEIEDRIHTKYGDRMRLIKTLQAEGMTFEKYRQQIRDEFILVALRSKNISQELIISPHKVEKYYVDHKDEYKVQDEVKLRMIVLNKNADSDATTARKLADEIVLKLKEGASFEELAKTYSQGTQRREGGDWGWVEKSILRKELADAAFALNKGQTSDVIDTADACYVMLVEDKRQSHYKTLGEVRDVIERNLMLEERNRLEKQWVERLKKKTFVRYF